MDPADSRPLPRDGRYSGAGRETFLCRVRDYHPLWSNFPERFCYKKVCSLSAIKGSPVLQPLQDKSRRFRLVPFRSPLLRKSRLLSLPPGTEMFQFPGFATHAYGFSMRPSRGSRDQRSFDSFPGLIAVFHALHRLLAPRHPPHALSSLAALILSSARSPSSRLAGTLRTGPAARYRPTPRTEKWAT
jgi:hypothetical protein